MMKLSITAVEAEYLVKLLRTKKSRAARGLADYIEGEFKFQGIPRNDGKEVK